VLHLIDVALEGWLRATVPLSAQDVDVSFEAPDREWSAKLTRPTVNVFLWDVRRSSRREQSGIEELERDGRIVRRPALPRVELRYVVTAWTTDHGDERAILGGLLRTVLAHPEMPATYVPTAIADLPAMRLLLARTGDDQPDFGTTLDGQLRPGLALTVVAAIDTGDYTPAGPPVEAVELRTRRLDTGSHETFPTRWVAGEVGDQAAIGATVVSPRGTATVNTAGRFVIAAAANDELVIETAPPTTVLVPVEGGVRV
jgi:Pvc16 N-terminal domain